MFSTTISLTSSAQEKASSDDAQAEGFFQLSLDYIPPVYLIIPPSVSSKVPTYLRVPLTAHSELRAEWTALLGRLYTLDDKIADIKDRSL